jgi:hypothetical protein
MGWRGSIVVQRASVALLTLLFFACDERRRATYVTFADAERDRAVARGVVPPCLEKAQSIDEEHDLDTNEVWGRFVFSASDAPAVKTALAPAALPDAARIEIRQPMTINDWPENFESAITSGVSTCAVAAYQCRSGGRFVILVNWQTRSGFYARSAS